MPTAIRVPTVSSEPGPAPDSVFAVLHQRLAAGFPRVQSALRRETFGGSLLFTWRGADTTVPAIVLTGHLDVVPVDSGSEGRWTHPPFAGVVSDGYVWGRGALDDKASVLAILEAIEALLAEGFGPRARSISPSATTRRFWASAGRCGWPRRSRRVARGWSGCWMKAARSRAG